MVTRQLRESTKVDSFRSFDRELIKCRACPRLVEWREKVAREKRASFAADEYWGSPVPGFGDPQAWLFVLGLAPAAHGGNRTGRIFTGDRSGDWLFAAMNRMGLSNQPESTSRDDGLQLRGARVSAAVHCAPPGNAPTTSERDNCAHWLSAELRLLRPSLQVVVALGAFAWSAALSSFAVAGYAIPKPKPKFGHLKKVKLASPAPELRSLTLIGSYHPSQQNTFTGRLTEPMLDAVFETAISCHT